MSETIKVTITDYQEKISIAVRGPNIPGSGGGGVTKHSELALDDGTNPHNTTKSDVGLGNVPNIDLTADNAIKEGYIDFGLLAGQVRGSSIPINIIGITSNEIEAALFENRLLINVNSSKVGVTNQISSLVEDLTPQLGGELDLNSKSVGDTPQVATGDGTTLIDWRKGNLFNFQFGAFNETFTFTDPTLPGTFILKLTQDSLGSRTATFPATVKWIDGTAPTLTTTATTGTDIITLYFDGTNYYCVQALNFS